MHYAFQAFFSILIAIPALAQSNEADRVVSALEKQARQGRYALEGTLTAQGQFGFEPGRELTKAKFRIASAPGGRSLLAVEAEGKAEYRLISNGQKNWAFVPKLKQYTEAEGVLLEDDVEDDGSSNERDPAELFCRILTAHLKEIYRRAGSAEALPEAMVGPGRQKRALPGLRVMAKPDSRGGLTMTEIQYDPRTLEVSRLLWANSSGKGEKKTVLRATFEFSRFEYGEGVADSMFEFEPPKGARLVETVPIPGQTGSYLVGQMAPDFELKTIDGKKKVRLSSLRGEPVVLAFWASWCGPCRRELPELSDLVEKLGEKGLRVFGVNDEGSAAANEFSEKMGLAFPTLDDGMLRVHKLYRVQSIPSTYLIDRDGRVVRYLKGSRSKAELKAAMAALGF